MKPTPMKPRIIIAQVEASGIALTWVVKLSTSNAFPVEDRVKLVIGPTNVTKRLQAGSVWQPASDNPTSCEPVNELLESPLKVMVLKPSTDPQKKLTWFTGAPVTTTLATPPAV